MVWFALSLQGQVEKYGAYVGIAAFFGLAVLSLLYFSQARELKRLRDWAGRAPERSQELEERVVAQATSSVAGRAPGAPFPPAATATGAIAPPRRLAEMPPPTGAATAAGGQATELADAVEAEPATNGTVPAPPRGPGGSVPAGPAAPNGAAPPDAADAAAEAGDDAQDDAAAPTGGETAAVAAGPTRDEPPAAATDDEDAAAGQDDPAPATADGAAGATRGEDGAAGATRGEDGAAGATRGEDGAAGATRGEDGGASDEDAGAPDEAAPAPAVPRATPAQRVGVTPRPAPLPLRQAKPSAVPPSGRAGGGRRPAAPDARRPAAKPPCEGRSAGTIALLVGLAVLILGGGTFLVSQLVGGEEAPAPPNQSAPPPTQTSEPGTADATPAPPAGETNVAVLNGTTFTGLAGQIADRVAQQGGYQRGITETNTRDQTLQSSTVYYADGFRGSARAVAKLLSIDAVEPLDAETRALAPDADVVVLAGADQAP